MIPKNRYGYYSSPSDGKKIPIMNRALKINFYDREEKREDRPVSSLGPWLVAGKDMSKRISRRKGSPRL